MFQQISEPVRVERPMAMKRRCHCPRPVSSHHQRFFPIETTILGTHAVDKLQEKTGGSQTDRGARRVAERMLGQQVGKRC